MLKFVFFQYKYRDANRGSVWRPIRGPLRDWPLGLCDLTTFDRNDLIPLDEVHTDDTLESYQVHYRKTQKWCYLTDQLPTELLIFKAADSMVEGAGMNDSVLEFLLSCNEIES